MIFVSFCYTDKIFGLIVVQNYLTCEAILLNMNIFAPQTVTTIIMYALIWQEEEEEEEEEQIGDIEREKEVCPVYLSSSPAWAITLPICVSSFWAKYLL